MSNINKQALTDESARESGNILIIVAARMARRELFTPLHLLCELPQRVVSTRTLREAVERSEETLQREVCKIVDGHRLMEKKLKEAEAKLEAAERRIAELEWDSEQAECVNLCLNELGVPKAKDEGQLSLWGRVVAYGEISATERDELRAFRGAGIITKVGE